MIQTRRGGGSSRSRWRCGECCQCGNVASGQFQLPIGWRLCADRSGWGCGFRPRKAWERGLPARDIGCLAGRGGTPHPLAPRARCPRSQESSSPRYWVLAGRGGTPCPLAPRARCPRSQESPRPQESPRWTRAIHGCGAIGLVALVGRRSRLAWSVVDLVDLVDQEEMFTIARNSQLAKVHK